MRASSPTKGQVTGTELDVRLRWVEADPARERAVDALGLGIQADRIADTLLPELSVLTRRARYLSFFCWAVHEVQQAGAPIRAIHRLEAGLACDEAKLHLGEASSVCPDIVGRQRATNYLANNEGTRPKRPERLYKNTAFAAYRPLLRRLGLLNSGMRPELTRRGHELADAFAASRGRHPWCLSEISGPEQTLIKGLLGLDFRRGDMRLTESQRRRRHTFLTIRNRLIRGDSALEIIARYAATPLRPLAVPLALHRAYIWETLSQGLTLAFSLLLRERRLSSVARRLKKVLRCRCTSPALSPLDPAAEDCPASVVGLVRDAMRLRPLKYGLEPSAVHLASALLVDGDPVSFLRQIVDRHQLVKPDGPWIVLEGDRVRAMVPSKSLAFTVRARTYRIDAYAQLVRDLGLLS